MISMQLLDGVLVALAVLAAAAVSLSVVIAAAASAARRGQPPHGGTHRDLPPSLQPTPSTPRVLILH